MEYQYRNVRAEFDTPDKDKCGYRFYCKGAIYEVCVDHGTVIKGREVPDLSSCALKEFARKYIDVNYSRLCSDYNPEVVLERTPLSDAALDIAASIQDAANKEVQRIAQSSEETITISYSDLDELLDSDTLSVWDLCDVILEGVAELPGYQAVDTNQNEMILQIKRQQTNNVPQTMPSMPL